MWPVAFSSTKRPVPPHNSRLGNGTKSVYNTDAAFSILVAEDDKVTRELLGLMLAKKFPGAAVHFAENGQRGVELFDEHAPDIVITDIAMPMMDGIRMAGEIKARKSDTKFIVITAYSDAGNQEKFAEIGFSDFLVKPIDFARMFAAIEKCVAEITQGSS